MEGLAVGVHVAARDRPQEGGAVGLTHGEAAALPHRAICRDRHHRLGQRCVGAPVNQPDGLLNMPFDGEAGAAALPACLEQLEAQNVVERTGSRIGLVIGAHAGAHTTVPRDRDMATFDQLSDEQRAIVELVLQQSKSYDELADMLGMPERRVRELARDALVDLAPISARGVEEDWRGQLADYVLGQQAGPEVTATRGHLRRSEAARVWTRSLLDSLEQLYPNGDLPAIPEGERGRERAAAGAGDAVQRRRILAAAGIVALLLIGLLVWPLGLLTGGDDDEGSASTDGGSTAQTSGGQGEGASGQSQGQPQGQAVIAEQGGKTQLVVTATGLEPSTERSAYQVWLYNSAEDRKSLGATVTDAQGRLQSGGELPADYRKYRFIDLTSVAVEGANQQSFQSGPSVLRGLLELRDKPVTRGTGNKRVSLLAEIRLLALPESG
jgi:Sigma-70, region 4